MIILKYKIVKTAIELNSLNDLVRLVTYLFSYMGIRRPHVYLTQIEGKWLYYIRVSHFISFYKPLIITYYYQGSRGPQKGYIEYQNERQEKIKFLKISELVNPASKYVAVYKIKKTNTLLDPFSSDVSLGIEYRDKIELRGVPIIELDFKSLARISIDMNSPILSIRRNSNSYIYVGGFIIPIISLGLGDSSISPVFIAKGPEPMVNDKLAPFIKARSDKTDEVFEFSLGIELSERYIPLIHAKGVPFEFAKKL